MTLKRTIKLLKEYLKMNNIIKLTDKAEVSSLERTANKYRPDEINIINEANIYGNIKENIKELTIEPSALASSSLERMTEPITKEKLTKL